MSGVVVATMTRSTSAGAMPAMSRALRAACSARSDVVSAGAAMRRSRMPVRARIQASLVSTLRDSSSLVSTRAGR